MCDGLLQERRKIGGFLEDCHAQDLEDFVLAAVEFQLPFQDRNQHVGADGNPDLSPYCVGRSTEEMLDPQVLLDPLEEQFVLPAALVKLRYRGCRLGGTGFASASGITARPSTDRSSAPATGRLNGTRHATARSPVGQAGGRK